MTYEQKKIIRFYYLKIRRSAWRRWSTNFNFRSDDFAIRRFSSFYIPYYTYNIFICTVWRGSL